MMERNGGPGRKIVAVCIGVNSYECRELAPLENAVADAESIATAIEQTQGTKGCVIFRLFSDADSPGHPTKKQILRTLREARSTTDPEDTVLVFFAGHGRTVDGRPALIPQDGNPFAEQPLESLLSVEEIWSVFRGCPARYRIMLLDACGVGIPARDKAGLAGARNAGEAGRWRARGAVSAEFVEGIAAEASGWVVVTACGAGQVSLEEDDHGLFSYYVAAGLRGQADLDRDGVVDMAELVQYVAKQVPAAAESAAGLLQEPSVIWRGPASIPLTRLGGVPNDPRPVQQQRTSWPGPGFPRLWLRKMRRGWRMEGIRARSFLVLGIGLLFGAVVSLEALIFTPTAQSLKWTVFAVALGIASLAVWWAVLSLAVAACEAKWHGGGYVTATVLAVWHLVIFALVSRHAAAPGSRNILAIDLFAIASVMIALGLNAFQFVVAVADLLARGERIPAHTGLRELERKWLHARIPNLIAMQSIHPLAYFLLFGLGGGALLLVHMARLLWSPDLDSQAWFGALRDLALLLLIWSQAAWYQAAYRFLSGEARPQV